jgi:hypothetical protein
MYQAGVVIIHAMRDLNGAVARFLRRLEGSSSFDAATEPSQGASGMRKGATSHARSPGPRRPPTHASAVHEVIRRISFAERIARWWFRSLAFPNQPKGPLSVFREDLIVFIVMSAPLLQRPHGVVASRPCSRPRHSVLRPRSTRCRAVQLEEQYAESPDQSYAERTTEEESGFSTDDGTAATTLADRLAAAGALRWLRSFVQWRCRRYGDRMPIQFQQQLVHAGAVAVVASVPICHLTHRTPPPPTHPP